MSGIKKVTSECFATWSANVTAGARKLAPVIFFQGVFAMDNIKFYEVSVLHMWIIWHRMHHIFLETKKMDSRMKENI